MFGKPAAPAMPRFIGQLERNIATAHFLARRDQECVAFCRPLTESHPQDGFAWKLLAASLYRLGRAAEALEPGKHAALLLKEDWDAFNNLGSIHKACGNNDFAHACFEHALKLNPKHPESLSNMAELLCETGRPQEAIACFEQLRQLNPADGYVTHMLSSLRGEQTDQAPADYVTKIFDSYAANFDTHLTQDLGYRAPQQLVELLNQPTPMPAHGLDVLDLGCGTGLTGEAIAAHARHLIGVDLSSGMLAKARARGHYQQLVEADLVEAMKGLSDASIDIALSADVFIYVGRLEPVLPEIRRVLRAGGRFAFSVEQLAESSGRDVQLEASGRYSHASSYLQRMAEQFGFRIVQEQDTALRQDTDRTIPGRLCVWA